MPSLRTIEPEPQPGFADKFLKAVEAEPTRKTRQQQVEAILNEAKPGIDAALKKNIPASEIHKLLLAALPEGSSKPSLRELREAAGLARKQKKRT